MLLQQTQSLQGNVPPMVIPFLVAELFSAFGKEEQAEQIRNYQPQPDPMQQAMQQMEMMKLQAEIEYYKAQTAAMYAKAGNTEAQAATHRAKADNVDADTLNKIRPSQSNPVDDELTKAKIDSIHYKTAIDAMKAKADIESKKL